MEVAPSGILNMRFMGTQVPFSLPFQGPSISIPVVHILFQETSYGADHMQESLSQSLLFIRKILFQSPGIREKTPGPHDHDKCANLPGTQPSSFLAFLIPFTNSSFLPFYKSERNVKAWCFKGMVVTFLINAISYEFWNSIFFSVVNLTLCVWSCYSQVLAFLLCCNLENNCILFLASQ